VKRFLILLIILALLIALGGAVAVVAWKTTYFDRWLPLNVKDFLGRVPPVISQVRAKGITQTEATIFWQTSEGATTQVEYGTTLDYGSQTPEETILSTAHMASLKGLTRGTRYHFRVKSKDANGNLTISEDFTFNTVDPVAGWKTYSDSLLGFKIRYPPKWIFETTISERFPGYDHNVVLFGPAGQGELLSENFVGLALILWDLNKPKNQSLKSYAEETLTAQLGKEWKGEFLPKGPTVKWHEVKYENLTWLGVIANDGKAGGYFTAKGARVYAVEAVFSPNRAQIELMLTTFK